MPSGEGWLYCVFVNMFGEPGQQLVRRLLLVEGLLEQVGGR
jgi:hypothetical protein